MKNTIITKNTLVPISLVIAILGFIVGAVTISNTAIANAKAIDKLEQKQDELPTRIEIQDMKKILDKLELKIDNVDKNVDMLIQKLL